jgi:hypothetical protein
MHCRISTDLSVVSIYKPQRVDLKGHVVMHCMYEI